MADNQLETLERFFMALADRTRLRLLNLMVDQEVCVCYFVEILDAPQPTISRHLAYLRRSGLVAARRQGKWMHYRIVPPASKCLRQLLAGALLCLREDKQMRHDHGRLKHACCAPEKFVALVGAPVPQPATVLGGRRS